MEQVIIALDLGTTGNRAIAYTEGGEAIAHAYEKFTQHYPHTDWVEHDPMELWQSALRVLKKCASSVPISYTIGGVGIANQRETVVLWNRKSGEPIARAIVWQDRRTADFCQENKDRESWIRSKTGLFLDPYFSATKIAWLLDFIPNARTLAEKGDICMGTIDTWILWNLTNGQVYATDHSNASRTLLYNLESSAWDEELCDWFSIPITALPEIRPSLSNFGMIVAEGAPSLPVLAVLGDQQASLFGHGCGASGDGKITFGTGAFFLTNTGTDRSIPNERLLKTVAWFDEAPMYALEGSIFNAGSAIEWLLSSRLLASLDDIDRVLEEPIKPNAPLCIPAFSGLGAPCWNPNARARFDRLSLTTTPDDLVAATLEGIAYLVSDLFDATFTNSVRVDGGLTRSYNFLRLLAAVSGKEIRKGHTEEMTACGVARAAAKTLECWEHTGGLAASPAAQSLHGYPRDIRRVAWHDCFKTVAQDS